MIALIFSSSLLLAFLAAVTGHFYHFFPACFTYDEAGFRWLSFLWRWCISRRHLWSLVTLKPIIRILKHGWHDGIGSPRPIATGMLYRQQQLIAASKQQHSGEIRICVEASLPLNYCRRDVSTRAITRQRALAMFRKLPGWDTENNNGVLIYLLLAEHAIALIADLGLNQFVNSQL